MRKAQSATVKLGASMRSAVVRTPHREASIIITARHTGVVKRHAWWAQLYPKRRECGARSTR
jgi:hypothetical protein